MIYIALQIGFSLTVSLTVCYIINQFYNILMKTRRFTSSLSWSFILMSENHTRVATVPTINLAGFNNVLNL